MHITFQTQYRCLNASSAMPGLYQDRDSSLPSKEGSRHLTLHTQQHMLNKPRQFLYLVQSRYNGHAA